MVRPPVTRALVTIEIAGELASDPKWHFQQVQVRLLSPEGEIPGVMLSSKSTWDGIEQVANGEVQLALINPSAPLTLALRGTGPFKQPIPLRGIAVIPSLDCFAFAVSRQTGITSLQQLRDQRYPLRVSVRSQRTHADHLLMGEVFGALGFSLDQIVSWGGQIRWDPGLPATERSAGLGDDTTRLDLVRRGELDALFDEGADSWVGPALDAEMQILSLDEPLVQKLEATGFRRSVITKNDYPKLEQDVLTLDFSGWPIYTHAEVPDSVITAFCAALEKRRDHILWQEEGPLPIERMVKDTPEAPLGIPLHPAAERFWRERGYLV